MFLVEPEVPMGVLWGYLTSIPEQVKVRGFLFTR